MNLTDKYILGQRLKNQLIVSSVHTKPADVVHHMLAMQAQEYAMALWAIGLRSHGSTMLQIEDAFNSGSILRTHVLRPTWHFVSPADIRWMLALTSPHIHKFNSYYYRQWELDVKIFTKAHKIIARSLEGNFRQRKELQLLLAKSGIKADGLRLGALMMHAELEGLICSGPRQGKQFTYALMDERVPKAKTLTREEALHELGQRYFGTRGPATVHDLAYWSGISVKDAEIAAAELPGSFEKTSFNGHDYYWKPVTAARLTASAATFLMPIYDEYGMSYKDRSQILTERKMAVPIKENVVFSQQVVANGKLVGEWRRTVTRGKMDIDMRLHTPQSPAGLTTVEKAKKRYLDWWGELGFAPIGKNSVKGKK